MINSDGSSGSDKSTAGLPHSPLAAGMAGYSPFMGAPWTNSLYTASDAPGPPTLDLPNSPMSPGGCDTPASRQPSVTVIDSA